MNEVVRVGVTTRAFDVELLDIGMWHHGGPRTVDRVGEVGLPYKIAERSDGDARLIAITDGASNSLPESTRVRLSEEPRPGPVGRVRPRAENTAARLRPRAEVPDFVGESPAIRAVLEMARQIAPTDGPVVILGESGTGKDVLARMIHALSRRRAGPFVDVHCGAMADQLLESELFGHERGAFTGAVADKPGLFEIADGGTLFLDEFAEMSPQMQTKLLKVLDYGELRRVGGVRTMRVEVRVLVATNRNLDELVRGGRVREDLLYRVDVIRITLPPLRERPEDVPRLVAHFLALHQRMGVTAKTLTPRALRLLQRYAWPGNVRELVFALLGLPRGRSRM